MERIPKFLAEDGNPNLLGRFERYEIKEILGRGGMGIVLRGHDPALNRDCAIKVLAPELATSAAARKRFSREARCAAAVVHPHVVPIQTVDEHEGLPFLVMPVVEGDSLEQRVKTNGPLSVIETVRIAAQIAQGLAAAHAQGLVHRDIKPANILLQKGVERVQITDFGLARTIDDASMTRSGMIAGTPQYMSPEQAHGDLLDARSDQFSLGSVMYFMLTGRSPFRAETTMGILNRIVNDEPRSLRSVDGQIPEWLEAVVSKLLSKSANERFASAEEVATTLEQWLAHLQQPTTIEPPQPIPVARPLNKRRTPITRWLIATCVFAFMTFAAVIIILETDRGTITIKSDSEVPVRIRHGEEVVEQLTVIQGETSTTVKSGTYIIEVDGKSEAFTVDESKVQIGRGGEVIVTIVQSDIEKDDSGRQMEFDMLSHFRVDRTSTICCVISPLTRTVAAQELTDKIQDHVLGHVENSSVLTGEEGKYRVWRRTSQLEAGVQLTKESQSVKIPGNQRELDDSLKLAIEQFLDRTSNRKELILVAEDANHLWGSSLIEECRSKGIRISVVYLDHDGGLSTRPMLNAVLETGGRYFRVDPCLRSRVTYLVKQIATADDVVTNFAGTSGYLGTNWQPDHGQLTCEISRNGRTFRSLSPKHKGIQWGGPWSSIRTFREEPHSVEVVLHSKATYQTLRPLLLEYYQSKDRIQCILMVRRDDEPSAQSPIATKRKALHDRSGLIQPGDTLAIRIPSILPHTGPGKVEPELPVMTYPSGITCTGYPLVVAFDGTIRVPFIDPVDVANKTVRDAETAILEGYTKADVLSPDTTIIVARADSDSTSYEPRIAAFDTLLIYLPGILPNNSRGAPVVTKLKTNQVVSGIPAIVDEAGSIQLPHLGEVKLLGLNVRGAERKIRKLVVEKDILRPGLATPILTLIKASPKPKEREETTKGISTFQMSDIADRFTDEPTRHIEVRSGTKIDVFQSGKPRDTEIRMPAVFERFLSAQSPTLSLQCRRFSDDVNQPTLCQFACQCTLLTTEKTVQLTQPFETPQVSVQILSTDLRACEKTGTFKRVFFQTVAEPSTAITMGSICSTDVPAGTDLLVEAHQKGTPVLEVTYRFEKTTVTIHSD